MLFFVFPFFAQMILLQDKLKKEYEYKTLPSNANFP